MKQKRHPKELADHNRKVKDDYRIKTRNWMAVHAHFRTGAGNHGDAKKQDSKTKAREKVKYPGDTMSKYKVIIEPAPIEYIIEAKDDDEATAAAMDDFKNIDTKEFAKILHWSTTLIEDENGEQE